MTAPVLIGFDVEPDGLDIARHERRRWTGFERAFEIVERLREPLAEITGGPVNFAWYLRMDPQITDVYGSTTWVAETYGTELAALAAHGDEIGLHPHALRWDTRTDRWLTDTANQGWVEECVLKSFEAFQRVFGRPCRAHRFGDRFMSNAVVRLLRELGVAADLTLEPGRGEEIHAGLSEALPDQTDVPRLPYHPDPADFGRAAPLSTPDDLWMLPITSADPDRALSAVRRIGRRVRHIGQPMNRPILLWAPWPSNVLWDIVAGDVESDELSVLPFMVRCDTLLRADWAESFENHLRALAEHPFGRQVALTTPSNAVAQLSKPTE